MLPCPQCGFPTEVLETRYMTKPEGAVRRRRKCKQGHRITTIEVVVKEVHQGVSIETALKKMKARNEGRAGVWDALVKDGK